MYFAPSSIVNLTNPPKLGRQSANTKYQMCVLVFRIIYLGVSAFCWFSIKFQFCNNFTSISIVHSMYNCTPLSLSLSLSLYIYICFVLIILHQQWFCFSLNSAVTVNKIELQVSDVDCPIKMWISNDGNKITVIQRLAVIMLQTWWDGKQSHRWAHHRHVQSAASDCVQRER